MKGRPPGKPTGPRKPGAAPQGRARGAAKAARARKPDAPKPAARPPVKTPAAKTPAAKTAARSASSSPAKGVSLDVRQFRVAADDDGIRLDRWFQRHLPDIGFNTVSRWARTGQLRVDGARAAPGDRIAEGQTIRVPPAEPKAPETAKPKRVRPQLTDDQAAFAQGLVIHRDAQAIVINKPPGLATQGGTKTDDHVDGLLDALEFDLDQRPKLVHRLDKDTSGALLVARTARSAAFFAKAFSSRTARKVYWAIVMGVPSIEDGMIELPIAKQPGTGGEKMHVDEEEGLPSRSRYRVIERAGNRAAWVELQPYTGRTHQLRVHMAAIGHPIVGDGKYGGKDAFLSGTISRKMHLHARRIRVDHPDGGRVDVRAELPEHFAASLASLGFDLSAGDLPLDEEVARAPTREDEKKAARAHAKQIRKGRKGERRARGSGGGPRRK
ncbi:MULTISPECIES: RluA family pseudouridine synthase [Sphingobium]|uniref:Ribosomal large subunit pseudouridine synthase D n=2 Tax=Sphingobium fuliginis (strain ATCC 27551) TaxID=336203 RepID=A0ABQ1FDC0_SPHSA|nr:MULTISPECIES: RluA family pseudouridine synthase [Sphingobium]AJR24903.1 pseudouridine synthase [Sphingobium sp. YBL2]QDC36236.1 RluA family pseudouridine synthase [Sphingobium fuliginis ATCC 27551]RYL95491.1 RluA family pseudouridine synthase [Sphingobium fuliginis]UXC91264.1 RluA family pseudouridine synthase [Sphingobium sp. RSMS]WDA37097.1 RluA family pseudouridine synthase [Sphingobium sp. YC-XJ3]